MYILKSNIYINDKLLFEFYFDAINAFKIHIIHVSINSFSFKKELKNLMNKIVKYYVGYRKRGGQITGNFMTLTQKDIASN